MPEDSKQPTIYDLHTEQVKQSVILGTMQTDVKEIKSVLLGAENRSGLVMDVDRLKRSNAILNAVVWLMFTTAIGSIATVAVAYFK